MFNSVWHLHKQTEKSWLVFVFVVTGRKIANKTIQGQKLLMIGTVGWWALADESSGGFKKKNFVRAICKICIKFLKIKKKI